MWIGVAIKSHRPRFRAGKGIRLEREEQGFSGETCSRVEIQSANGREVSRSERDNENRIGNGSKAGIFSPRRSFFFDKASYIYIYPLTGRCVVGPETNGCGFSKIRKGFNPSYLFSALD